MKRHTILEYGLIFLITALFVFTVKEARCFEWTRQKNVSFTVQFPLVYSNNGSRVANATGLDSEWSYLDAEGGNWSNFADCGNEATTLDSGNSYQLILNQTEANHLYGQLQVKTNMTNVSMLTMPFRFIVGNPTNIATTDDGGAVNVTSGKVDEVSTLTGHTAQTGDAYARLGAPAGASVSADVAAVKSDSAAILIDTGTTLDDLVDDLETRLTSTRAGYLDYLNTINGKLPTNYIMGSAVQTAKDDEIDDTLTDTAAMDTANELRTLLTGGTSALSTYAGTDTSGTTTLLSRIVGTLATGTHNPQSGDAYGIVNNVTYGNSALNTAIGTRLATSGYTAPPTVAQIQAELEENGASLLDTIRDDVEHGTYGLNALLTAINLRLLTSAYTAPPSAADVKTALEANGSKLDHFWEMTEDDGGVRRLTQNALELAPSGGGGTVAANVVQINGTAIAGTGAQVAAGFEHYFNVETPSKTMNDAGGESSLTQQNIRDAMKLAPSAGAATTGSIDAQLATAQADLDNPAQYKADVSGVATTAQAAAIQAKTDNLPSDPADASVLAGLIATAQADLDNPSQYKADVSTLESRLSAARAGYLDKLNVTGTLANTDNAASFKATGFSTHSAADVAALILTTPANKIATDASGQITVGDLATAALAKFFSQNSGKLYADAVAGSIVKEIVDNVEGGTGSSLTVENIVDGIDTEFGTQWDRIDKNTKAGR